jgi:hypothetical protein
MHRGDMQALAATDDIFLLLALALLVWARFSAIRDRRALRRSIRALRAASRAWQAEGGDIRAIAEIAAQLHRIDRGANEIMREGRRRLTVRLKGRTGRLDLVDNFFLRNPRVAVEIELWLLDLEAACTRAIAADLRAYRSPLNPLNAPSSIIRFLGVDPPPAVEYAFDAFCWLLLVAIAWLMAAGTTAP